MNVKLAKSASGFTIIEAVIAVVVLVIAVLGASAFRYQAALHARRADLQMTAARTTLLLCETWRGAIDPNAFAPAEDLGSQLTIETSAEGPETPDGFTALGNYRITPNGLDHYYATLSWKDMSSRLRALNVAVEWNQAGSGSENFVDADKSFKLTTYITD